MIGGIIVKSFFFPLLFLADRASLVKEGTGVSEWGNAGFRAGTVLPRAGIGHWLDCAARGVTAGPLDGARERDGRVPCALRFGPTHL